MATSFQARNAFYLRVSRTNVLPLYLYLDERHVDWMSDYVLQRVLADLKPLIPKKLEEEADAQIGLGGPANAKKGTVDVHRGDTYQFAYFLRKVEPHSVLIKSRNFTLAPPQPKPIPPPQQATKAKTAGKRKTKASAKPKPVVSKKRKTVKNIRSRTEDVDSDVELAIDSDDDNSDVEFVNSSESRSSRQTRQQARQVAIDTNDADIQDATSAVHDVDLAGPSTKASPVKIEEGESQNQSVDLDLPMDLDIEEEEPKPKPVLQLSYQNFDLSGHCLCLIVEPWPSVRAVQRAPSRALSTATLRASSIAPPDFVSSERARARTPLFLPDDDDDQRETLRIPEFPQQRVLPPVPLFNAPQQDDEEEDDNAELMQFSQVLNKAGTYGDANDDDELEGAVLFGDADEVREL